MINNARKHVKQFSNEAFVSKFAEYVQDMFIHYGIKN